MLKWNPKTWINGEYKKNKEDYKTQNDKNKSVSGNKMRII